MKKALKFFTGLTFIILLTFLFLIIEPKIPAKTSGIKNTKLLANEEKQKKEELINYTDFYEINKSKIVKNYKKTYLLEQYLTTTEQVVKQETSFEYDNDVIKIESKQSYSFKLNVQESGLYEIYFDYYLMTPSIITTEAAMMINNQYQYYELKQLVFESLYEPTTSDFSVDRYGNEIVPSSKRVNKWYIHNSLKDGSLLQSKPMLINLSKDIDNVINLYLITGSVLVGNIYLESQEENLTYNDYISKYNNTPYGKEVINIAPEYIYTKTDVSSRIYSSSEASCDRYDSVNKLLNCVYHDTWKRGNQAITWQVDIKESGLYNLAFKYNQYSLIDLPVQRRIAINGVVPYQELENYNFYYAKNWTNERIHNEEGLMYVYLEKGTNTITMSVSLDFYRYIIEQLDKIMTEMTEIALQIKYLNNGQTDKYREWKITQYIPTLKSDLESMIKKIEELIEYGNTLSNSKKGSSTYSNLRLAIKKLEKLAEDPDSIPNNLNNFTDGTSSASQLLGNTITVLSENPLGLEMIYLTGEDDKIPRANANFFVVIWEGIKRFILSFFNDEYSVDNSDGEEIEVWVNRSRQYIEIMQQLTDEAGYNVKFSIMPDESKLVLANAAKELPDLAMGVNSWIPYDLAIRGITVDLREFEGYENIVSNITKGVLIPYAYENGVYGLPETQDFWILYYRTDIFDRLNLTVPNTWDELVKLLPSLQNMGLNFYSPISAYIGLKPFVSTLPLLYQYGGNLYSSDGMTTNISSEENIEALKFMTNLFTIYNVPEEVPNFFNSFRQGTLPIGIANGGTYIQLSVAAPEIKGNWDVALHLGKEKDGTIYRYASSGSQGLTMFKSSDKKEETWDFVKWWMSTATQERYIETLYSIYGLEYLFFTSNNEAFDSMPIPSNHKEIIKQQFNWSIEASRIPAAYMVERSISDAYSKIVFNGVNTRIALDDAAIDANREIERKMEEFGYMKDGVKIKDYIVPTIYNIDDWLTEKR